MKGVIPFAPLMKPPAGVTTEQWFAHCVEAAKSIPQDVSDQGDYLAGMGILSGLVLDFEIIKKFISEELMYESSVVQHYLQQGLEQGLEQGARESTIESILDVLEVRFHSYDVQALKPALDSIAQLQPLKQLLREAARACSLNEFRHQLESSNGK